jgi:hypothetical protein
MLLGRAATLALAPELARASPAGAFAAELLGALDAEAADVTVRPPFSPFARADAPAQV